MISAETLPQGERNFGHVRNVLSDLKARWQRVNSTEREEIPSDPTSEQAVPTPEGAASEIMEPETVKKLEGTIYYLKSMGITLSYRDCYSTSLEMDFTPDTMVRVGENSYSAISGSGLREMDRAVKDKTPVTVSYVCQNANNIIEITIA